MRLMESGEDYLEMILMLQKKKGVVRSMDIAAELQVSRASVSVAMKNLKSGGYIVVGPDHEITLTDQGRELAETMYERHVFFSEVLYRLGVDQATARHDACRMEHVLSRESFRVVKNYFMENGVPPREGDPDKNGEEKIDKNNKDYHY